MSHPDCPERTIVLALHRSALRKVRANLPVSGPEFAALCFAVSNVEAFNDLAEERELDALHAAVLDRADATMTELLQLPVNPVLS